MEPAKRGYLQKRTRPKAWRRQEWLRRYFVFDSVRLELHYFVSSAQFGTEPTDSRRKLCVAGVQVGNDAIVPAQHGDIGAADAQLCFCVTDMHDSRANLLLCASSDEDRDAWIAALRDALRKAQAASQSPASPRTPGIQAVSGTERSGEDLDHDENEKVVEDLDRATRDEAQAKMRADLKREAESRNLVADYAQLEKEAAEEAAKEAEVEAAAEQELGEDAVSEFDADLDHDSDAGDTQRRRLRRQALSEEAIETSFANELERAAVNEEDDSQDRFSSGGGDKGAVQNKVKSENGAARPAHTVGTSTSRHSLSPESEPGACAELRSRQYWSSVLKQEPGSLGGDGGVQATLRVRGKKKEKAVGKAVLAAHGQGRSEAFQPLPCQICIEPDSGGIQRGDKAAGRIGLQLSLGLDIDMDSVHVEREGDVGTSAVEATLQRLVRPFTVGVLAKDLGGVGVSGHSMLSMLRVRGTGGARAPKAGVDDGTGATTTFLQFSVLAIDHSSPPPPTLIVSTSPSSQNALDTDQRGRSRSRGNRNSRSGLRNRSSSPPSSPSGLTARRGRSHSPVRSPTWLSRKSPGHINDDDRSLPVAHLQLRATPDALADHAEFLLACKAGVSRDIAAPDAQDEIPDSSTVAENLLHASGEMFTGDSAGLRRAVDCCSLEVHGKSNSASPEDARELVELIYRLKMRRRAARCIAVSAAATYRLRPARRRFHSALQAQKKARYDAKKRALQVAERRVRLLATYDEQRSTPRKSQITASAKNLDDFASEVLSPMSPSNEKEYDAADDGHKSRTKDAIKFAKAEERAIEMREKAEEAEKTLAEAQMELLKMLDEQMLEVTGPATSTGAFDPDADNTRKEKEDERRRWSQAALAAVRDEVRGKGSLPRWLSKPLLADDVIKRVNTHLQRTILTAVPRNTISVACQSVPGGQKLGTSTPTGPSTPQPWLSHDEGHLATPDEEVSRYRQEARDMLANGTISDGEYIKMVKQATDQEGENQQRKQSAVTRTMEALGQQPAVAMRDDLRARQLEQKEVDSDDGHGFVGRKVKAVDDLLQLVEEDIRLVSQWYDNKDAQHDGGSLDAHEVVELYLNTQAVQIVNFFERLALQCSHRCAQTAPRRRSRAASHSSDFGASDAFVDRGGWRPNDAFSVIFGALRCDARLRRIGKRAQGLREAEQGDVGRHIDLPSAAKAIDIARVCDAYIGIMRDSMGREMLHAVHALAGPGSIDDEEWARRVEEDSGSLNEDLLRCLLRYKGRASHVHSSLPSDVFKVVHLHMSLLDSALRTQGSLADTNVADIFTVDAKSADADYSTHLSLRCALRRGLLLAGVETLRQYFTAPLLRAARTAGRRPSGVRSVAKALFSTSQDNLQVPTIESERLLLALCNDCLECSTMIDELLRKYETGDDDTDSDDEDHDDHSVDDGNGCCSLQGPAWRRYRARAKHAFQQQLHQLGNICAERMADKILRVITHSDNGDWLSYQMLFDLDVALPESDGAGVRLRQQRSAGVPSLRRNATRRGSALATPASTGSGNGAHAQHTYRCEATGIVAMTLSEYLGIFGVLMNQYSLIRLQRALSSRLALRYIRAVLLPGIAADGNADVTGGGVARAKAFVTPRKWRQRSAANVMKPPPRGDTVFSDHEMFMRCLAGDTKSETRAVGELDWEWWASGVVLERPQAVKTVARRKKIAESGAMQALSDVATMLMAPNELVEDTSSIVHWFGGVVQRNPSVPTQVFAAVRAAFTARAGASVEGSNGAPPLTQQAVDDALSAIALSRHIRLPDDDDSEILAQHQSTEALHSQESQTLFKDLFPDAVSDFSKFRAAQKKRLQNMRQR